MTGKTYHSVAELIRDISDSEFADAFEARLAERRIIKQLMVQRAAKGLSQKDLAERMHCTQSRISKLESSTDGELSIAEVRLYAAAVGLELSVAFSDRAPKSKTKTGKSPKSARRTNKRHAVSS
jgi:predicted XRE-type DNA-binding protein